MLRNDVNEQPPEICGFECPFAAFPPADTAGICRTMAAVWCGKLEELVNKNSRCEWRRRCGEDSVREDASVVQCAPRRRGRVPPPSAVGKSGRTGKTSRRG